MNLLQLAKRAPLFPKFYWKCEGEERLALGKVFDCTELPTLNADLCLYGGGSFAKTPSSDPLWKEFPHSYFFLPLIEVVQNSQETRLTLRSEEFFDLDSWLALPSAKSTHQPKIVSRSNLPEYPLWERNIAVSLACAEIEKIVLARRTSVQFDAPLTPFEILADLKKSAVNSTLFGIQFSEDCAFVGASPEMLYERLENTISTTALAGTRQRGKTEAEESALKKELLSNEKEAREFAFVKEFIRGALDPFCDELVVEKKNHIASFATVHHLASAFKGNLKPPISDSALLAALHPTPAVGGYPRSAALELLSKIEPFGRGWYAAPVGFASANEARFAVAIRSALIAGKTAHLFSGAGIVEGSIAPREWEELENKINPFMRIFT
jgi:menaquinone-specific isochorismate synthase